MSSEEEADISAVLDEEKTADELIQKFLNEQNLENIEFKADENVLDHYPGTRCLVNYFGIKDRDVLRKILIYIVSLRTAELLVNPLDGPYNLENLKQIHEYLFSDVYPSAGTIRTKAAAKRTEFCLPEYIEACGKDIFDRLAKDHFLRRLERDRFIEDLAYYMGEVEALHPFRSGNAPAARLFFWYLISNSGYQIDWSQADPDSFLEADICAIDGDYQPLIDVLEGLIIEFDE